MSNMGNYGLIILKRLRSTVVLDPKTLAVLPKILSYAFERQMVLSSALRVAPVAVVILAVYLDQL